MAITEEKILGGHWFFKKQVAAHVLTHEELKTLNAYDKMVINWHQAYANFNNADLDFIDLTIDELNAAELNLKAAYNRVAKLNIPRGILTEHRFFENVN